MRHKKLKSSLELIKKRKGPVARDAFKLSCKFCSKKFSKPSQVVRHERIHTGVRPYKCGECGKAFTQKQSLDTHILRHTGQKPYACSFCSMKFSQRGNLRAHILRVHNLDGDERFQCQQCTCVFKRLGSLNAHISRFHPDSEPEGFDVGESELGDQSEKVGDHHVPGGVEAAGGEENSDLLSRAIQTAIAGASAALGQGEAVPQLGQMVLADRLENGKVRKHLVRTRLKEGVRFYACTFCNREFKKPSDLIRHVRIHTQERPYKCPHCTRAFTVKSTLLTHARIHQNMASRRQPPCPHCGKIFHTVASLKAHIKQHARPLHCPECPESFLTTGSLNSHRQMMHGKIGSQKNSADSDSPAQRLPEPLIITQQGLLQNAPRLILIKMTKQQNPLNNHQVQLGLQSKRGRITGASISMPTVFRHFQEEQVYSSKIITK